MIRTSEPKNEKEMDKKNQGIEGINLCGCGNPEGNVALIYKLLKARDLASAASQDGPSREDCENIHKAYQKTARDILSADPMATLELAMQLIDGASNFLEHGGSIHGAWLTESGEEFLRQVETGDPKLSGFCEEGLGGEMRAWAEQAEMDLSVVSPKPPAGPKRM